MSLFSYIFYALWPSLFFAYLSNFWHLYMRDKVFQQVSLPGRLNPFLCVSFIFSWKWLPTLFQVDFSKSIFRSIWQKFELHFWYKNMSIMSVFWGQLYGILFSSKAFTSNFKIIHISGTFSAYSVHLPDQFLTNFKHILGSFQGHFKSILDPQTIQAIFWPFYALFQAFSRAALGPLKAPLLSIRSFLSYAKCLN